MTPGLVVAIVFVAVALAFGIPAAASVLSRDGVMQIDELIVIQAESAGIDPALLKAIVRQESNFDPNAINPEQSYAIDGENFSASSRTGRARLVFLIKAGHDPKEYGLNPSLGLAQVRVATARDFLPGVTALQLLDPQINLHAAAAFLAWMFGKGLTVDEIDAYNVGFHGVTVLKRRNLSYRDSVVGFYREFKGKI